MERLGLVASIEAQLERMIGAGTLPESGHLPSEQTLARRFGVSRTTIREAMGRLAARGLVVQRAGRKTRAVALDETVTLENLGVALHGEGSAHSERRRLLEGYFALKLRLAARVARRPGHLLLIHSLERAWRGVQARVLPYLDAQAVYQWALRALYALSEADASALRRELMPLLRACDERVLERLTPVRKVDDKPRAVVQTTLIEAEPAREALADAACPNLSACRTGSCDVAPEGASPSGSVPADAHRSPGSHPSANPAHVPTPSQEGSLPLVAHDAVAPEPRLPRREGTSARHEGRQGQAWPIDPGGGAMLPAVAETG